MRMPKDQDGALALRAEPVQPESNELAADASTLVEGEHGQRSESNRQNRLIDRVDQRSTKQDVANDVPLLPALFAIPLLLVCKSSCV